MQSAEEGEGKGSSAPILCQVLLSMPASSGQAGTGEEHELPTQRADTTSPCFVQSCHQQACGRSHSTCAQGWLRVMHLNANWDAEEPVVTPQLQAGTEQSPWRSILPPCKALGTGLPPQYSLFCDHVTLRVLHVPGDRRIPIQHVEQLVGLGEFLSRQFLVLR